MLRRVYTLVLAQRTERVLPESDAKVPDSAVANLKRRIAIIFLLFFVSVAVIVKPGQQPLGSDDREALAADHPTENEGPLSPLVPATSAFNFDESDDDETWTTTTVALHQTSRAPQPLQTPRSYQDYIGSRLDRPPIH